MMHGISSASSSSSPSLPYTSRARYDAWDVTYRTSVAVALLMAIDVRHQDGNSDQHRHTCSCIRSAPRLINMCAPPASSAARFINDPPMRLICAEAQ